MSEVENHSNEPKRITRASIEAELERQRAEAAVREAVDEAAIALHSAARMFAALEDSKCFGPKALDELKKTARAYDVARLADGATPILSTGAYRDEED